MKLFLYCNAFFINFFQLSLLFLSTAPLIAALYRRPSIRRPLFMFGACLPATGVALATMATSNAQIAVFLSLSGTELYIKCNPIREIHKRNVLYFSFTEFDFNKHFFRNSYFDIIVVYINEKQIFHVFWKRVFLR